MPKPIIAVPADIRHFTGADWHAAQNQYVSAALKVAGVMSFIVPAFEDG
ncbi:MAG TPA: gamma-glutamyl-gamma-aminobutyrate hydrolase, partial [Agrobacterium sp.]|nr:gamma-glutamyl-gamma-aminobutyrate hydrolase [Agrobacterium sp.]